MKKMKLILTALGVLAIAGSSMAVKRSQVQLYHPNPANPNLCNVPVALVNPGTTISELGRLGSTGTCITVSYNPEP